METKWLLDFLSLVDTGNFSRSADARSTTQPAFSRRIKALEQWMGATLFDRSKHPVGLTPAGIRFHPVAEDVLRRLLQSRDEVRQIAATTENTLSFAATHSLSLVFFPDWIRSIEQADGVIRTRLDSHQIATCVQLLQRGACNFLLAPTHATVDSALPETGYDSVTVGHDRLLPVSAPDDSSGPRFALPGTAASPVDYLAYVPAAASGQAVRHLLAHHDPPAHLRCVFDSHMAGVLKSMVVQGRGLAWLPETEMLRELESGAVVLAGDPSWFIASEIRLFRSLEPLPDAAEAFWRRLGNAKRASA